MPDSLPFNGLRPEDFVVYEVEVSTRVRVVLHPDVVDRVDDDWRSGMYQLYDDEDILSHLLFNLLQGRRIDQLDGWADLPAFAAYVDEMERVDIDIVSKEPLPQDQARLLKWDHERWVESL